MDNANKLLISLAVILFNACSAANFAGSAFFLTSKATSVFYYTISSFTAHSFTTSSICYAIFSASSFYSCNTTIFSFTSA